MKLQKEEMPGYVEHGTMIGKLSIERVEAEKTSDMTKFGQCLRFSNPLGAVAGSHDVSYTHSYEL